MNTRRYGPRHCNLKGCVLGIMRVSDGNFGGITRNTPRTRKPELLSFFLKLLPFGQAQDTRECIPKFDSALVVELFSQSLAREAHVIQFMLLLQLAPRTETADSGRR